MLAPRLRLALCVSLSLPVMVAGVAACSSSGSLPPPLSNKQADDPCDPGQGATSTGTAPPVDAGGTPVTLPAGAGGIGFDELRFSSSLSQIMVPAAGTGMLDLLDPSVEQVTPIPGFSVSSTPGTSAVGVGSADEANGTIYAVDRTSSMLVVIDGTQKKIVGSTMTASAPGYVRYVGSTNEVWVTEPSDKRIEIFSLNGSTPVHSSAIAVGGAESLEIDAVNKRAFTNGLSSTFAIDVMAHSVSATWNNQCATARGLAVDPGRGWVMVGCEEGAAVVLDEHTGAVRGKVTTGAGIDRIAYDGARLRLYVPTPAKSSMVVVELGPTTGAASVKGSVDVAPDSHCVVTPGGGEVFVCVPSKGQVVFVRDPF